MRPYFEGSVDGLPTQAGVIPRAMAHIFEYLQASGGGSFVVHVSLVQVSLFHVSTVHVSLVHVSLFNVSFVHGSLVKCCPRVARALVRFFIGEREKLTKFHSSLRLKKRRFRRGITRGGVYGRRALVVQSYSFNRSTFQAQLRSKFTCSTRSTIGRER